MNIETAERGNVKDAWGQELTERSDYNCLRAQVSQPLFFLRLLKGVGLQYR